MGDTFRARRTGRPRKETGAEDSQSRRRSYWSEDGQVFYCDGRAWATELLERQPVDGTRRWDALPICLGFAANINDYLVKNPDACRRLSAREACGTDNKQPCWTEDLNQQFLQCVVDGFLSPKQPIWTTSTADVSKKDWNDKNPEWDKRAWSDGWKKVVTASEMCFVYAANKTWVVGVSK